MLSLTVQHGRLGAARERVTPTGTYLVNSSETAMELECAV